MTDRDIGRILRVDAIQHRLDDREKSLPLPVRSLPIYTSDEISLLFKGSWVGILQRTIESDKVVGSGRVIAAAPTFEVLDESIETFLDQHDPERSWTIFKALPGAEEVAITRGIAILVAATSGPVVTMKLKT